jgi:hypothetical protein
MILFTFLLNIVHTRPGRRLKIFLLKRYRSEGANDQWIFPLTTKMSILTDLKIFLKSRLEQNIG